jgi:hypothetical protein
MRLDGSAVAQQQVGVPLAEHVVVDFLPAIAQSGTGRPQLDRRRPVGRIFFRMQDLLGGDGRVGVSKVECIPAAAVEQVFGEEIALIVGEGKVFLQVGRVGFCTRRDRPFRNSR